MVVLTSTRLIFRHHEPIDMAAYCAMESDAQYRHPQPVHSPVELQRSFLDAWLPAKELGLLATVLKSTGEYIGRCGLYPRRNDHGETINDQAELAFYIARPYWGQGFATEAAKAFVNYGFEQLGLSRIYAGVNVLNVASIRVVRKAGLRAIRTGEGGGSKWQEFAIDKPDQARWKS